ncbi:MAG: NAD(P)-dependent alcohol dehydrogenase [Planctomycetota bacterium]
MRIYRFGEFGIEHLVVESSAPPAPRDGEVVIDLKALSLNYRDLMVVKGWYNPKLRLPATPISDGAGIVSAVGAGVTRVKVGDPVVSHFISGWIDGPVRADYARTTLGTPGRGLAAEKVALPAEAVVPIPAGYDFAQAATLPIAALTAWSCLRTVTHIGPGDLVLTLGTGGVSIFALQMAKRMGATVIITSSSDEKLGRASELGADHLINYRAQPEWDQAVLEITEGMGVDLTVETAGGGTLNQSLQATRAGGTIALLGALTGLEAKINAGLILMKRLRLAGIFVDCRLAFEAMNRFLEEHRIAPVIDRRYPFEELPEAFKLMEAGGHFGKIVVDI